MSWLSSLKQQVASGFGQLFNQSNAPVDGASRQPPKPSVLQRFGIFNFSEPTGYGAKAADASLRRVSEQVRVPEPPQEDRKKAPSPIRAPKINSSDVEPPVRGHKPYTIEILLPKGQKQAGYEQLQRAVIRDIFTHHGIYTSRAAVEDFIKTHGNLDLNEQGYRNKQGESAATSNRVPGLMPAVQDITNKVTGEKRRGYEFTITGELQSIVLGERAQAEAVTKAGTKVVPELSLNERMSKAMQIAYDKHLPHTIGAALKDVDPKQLMVGVAVAGGIVTAATKAGAAKALPLIGAGVTLAQVASYHAEAEAFVKMCAKAQTDADLDKAAQQFASVVKQAGVEIVLTLATAGASKLGAVSRAGGRLVDDAARLADDAGRAALGKFKQWNDEIVAGMKQAFGDDLVFETVPTRKMPTKTSSVNDPNLYSKSEELEMLKDGNASGRKAITETANKGLTEVAEAGMKRIKNEIPKEVMRQAKEQLVTLNVARTELIARLDNLVKNGNLLSDTKKVLGSAKNSLEYNLKQDDLVGALRDKFNQPVRVSGSGEAFDHLQEVRQGLNSLENARKILQRELKNKPTGSNEFVEVSQEIDAIKEMQRRVNTFLETK